jgi:3-methyladenine DNA glycosylase/8-oxoguanine DNA glycosylase
MSIDASSAIRHLADADPVMARLIGAAGPFAMREDSGGAFQALARSIIFQQLSGKAAGTIFGRFVGLFEELQADGFPAPGKVLEASEERLRSAGLSRQKIAAVRDLSEHFASGELGPDVFADLADDDVVANLTRVRGVGRWTAEMFLMFHLRRPDVLPVNDVGINRALRTQYGLESLPSPADVLRIGEPWRPWATVACWYLWRSEDVQAPA